MSDTLNLVLSLFNQYLFQEAKNNIDNVEYYFKTNPGTQGNQLIEELIGAIRTYDFDSIGKPLFDSILMKCRKTPDESNQIIGEVIKWKNYSKEQIKPSLKYLQDIIAVSIVKKANHLYAEHPSEYLKYLKNVNIQSSDIKVLGTQTINQVDINTILADDSSSCIPSRYKWINDSFDPHPGYEKGQMVIVTAPPGTGKSLWMMSEALFMAASGHKCIYFGLGDNSYKDFIIRMGAMYSGLSFADTSRSILNIYNGLKTVLGDNLEISVNPADTVSAEEIIDFVKARPDIEVIFVDYDSNLAGAGGASDSMYSVYGDIYAKFTELTLDNRLLFIASQPKISSWGNEVLEMTDVGESSRKQHTADIIIGIGRCQGCPNHVHTFKISKSRRGEEGVMDRTIRLNNGRFISLPKGVYDMLKGETEKKIYTEGEINRMIDQYNTQFNRTNQTMASAGVPPKPGANPFTGRP